MRNEKAATWSVSFDVVVLGAGPLATIGILARFDNAAPHERSRPLTSNFLKPSRNNLSCLQYDCTLFLLLLTLCQRGVFFILTFEEGH